MLLAPFSLLFDNESTLAKFQRVVVSAMTYVSMNSGGTSIVKGQLCMEGAGNGSNPSDPSLEAGMSAGVVGKLWAFQFPVTAGNPVQLRQTLLSHRWADLTT